MHISRVLGRSLRLVLAVALLAAAAGFGALAFDPGTSEAQGQSCPEGFVPNESGVGCVSAPAEGGEPDQNDTITATCVQGVLSDDGTQCIVPRLDAAPADAAAGSAGPAAPIPTFTG